MKWSSLTIVMAAFNEEESLPVCVSRTLAFLREHVTHGELIIVNDGSSDGTARIIDSLASTHAEIIGLHLDKNSGMGAALLRGYAQAQGDWIAMMPADGQIDAFEFLNFFESAQESDVVTSLYSNRRYSLPRKALSLGLRALTVGIVGTRARTEGSYMLKKEVFDCLGATSESFLLNLEIPIRAKKKGLKVATVYMKVHDRVAGESKAVNLRQISRTFGELFRLRLRMERERFHK